MQFRRSGSDNLSRSIDFTTIAAAIGFFVVPLAAVVLYRAWDWWDRRCDHGPAQPKPGCRAYEIVRRVERSRVCARPMSWEAYEVGTFTQSRVRPYVLASSNSQASGTRLHLRPSRQQRHLTSFFGGTFGEAGTADPRSAYPTRMAAAAHARDTRALRPHECHNGDRPRRRRPR